MSRYSSISGAALTNRPVASSPMISESHSYELFVRLRVTPRPPSMDSAMVRGSYSSNSSGRTSFAGRGSSGLSKNLRTLSLAKPVIATRCRPASPPSMKTNASRPPTNTSGGATNSVRGSL